MSLWRDDAKRGLAERALHLLSKAPHYQNLRLMWLVGDSADETEQTLRDIAALTWVPVEVIRADTGIEGMDPVNRRRRLATTCNQGLDQIGLEDDFVMIHESDLLSPPDVVNRLVEHAQAGRCPAAGWPWLHFADTNAICFYDIWAYRKDGKMFSNLPPFHECYKHDEPFEVDSVGSCWIFHAEDIRMGARMDGMACVGLCDELRRRGRHIWVDPTLEIVQEAALWVPHSTAD